MPVALGFVYRYNNGICASVKSLDGMGVKWCSSRPPDLFLSISSHKLLIYVAIIAIIMQCPCIEYGFVYIDMALLVCVCQVSVSRDL